MTREDYSTYYIQGSEHYLIPKDIFDELFNEMDNWKKEVQLLKDQLNYLRSGEYINQLKFERDMLQYIVNNGEVQEEDKNFIDMTHRNTELLEENQNYKEVIDRAIEYINEYAWKEDIIGDIYTVTGKPMVDKYMQLEWDNCKELLGILSEVE